VYQLAAQEYFLISQFSIDDSLKFSEYFQSYAQTYFSYILIFRELFHFKIILESLIDPTFTALVPYFLKKGALSF
jgi:hypothetical protein